MLTHKSSVSEVHHGVRITDGALIAAATYSNRYITDRFLPDKAIDLMDEAASALRLQQESKPEDILRLDQRIMTLRIELESLRKGTDIASQERREKLQSTLQECQDEAAKLTEKWEKERAEIDAIKKTKEDLEKARVELDQAKVRSVKCTILHHALIFWPLMLTSHSAKTTLAVQVN